MKNEIHTLYRTYLVSFVQNITGQTTVNKFKYNNAGLSIGNYRGGKFGLDYIKTKNPLIASTIRIPQIKLKISRKIIRAELLINLKL